MSALETREGADMKTSTARKLLDRLAHRLGYVRWDNTIQGSIEWKRDEQPYVDLKIPGGQRLSGWVDNRLSL